MKRAGALFGIAFSVWTGLTLTACDKSKPKPAGEAAAAIPRITLPCATEPGKLSIFGVDHPGQVINIVRCPDGTRFGTPDQPYTMVILRDHLVSWRLRNFSGKELWVGINFIEPDTKQDYGCARATGNGYWPPVDPLSPLKPGAVLLQLEASVDGSKFKDLELKPQNIPVDLACAYYRYQIVLCTDSSGKDTVGVIEPELIVEGRP